MKRIILVILMIFSVIGYGQTFNRYKDPIDECNVIRYYDSEFQMIIEKCQPFDSALPEYYKIGIYAIKINVPLDLFIKNGGIVSFEDGSKLKFKENVSLLYKGNDSNQISIVHQLNSFETEEISSKPINSFSVCGYSKEFDKWQKADILKAIKKLKEEKF